MKKLFWFSCGAVFGGVVVYLYSRLSESQKRYIIHLAKQIPDLAARMQV